MQKREKISEKAAQTARQRIKDRGAGKKQFTVSLNQKNYELFQDLCPPKQASDTLDLLVKCYLLEMVAAGELDKDKLT